jgi:hypothetical protein
LVQNSGKRYGQSHKKELSSRSECSDIETTQL